MNDFFIICQDTSCIHCSDAGHCDLVSKRGARLLISPKRVCTSYRKRGFLGELSEECAIPNSTSYTGDTPPEWLK